MIKLTFLGTSAGLPTKFRNVTALAVSLHNPYQKSKHKPWILVDCGEATQHQLLKTSLSVMQLELICITHVHGDHCYGLPGLLASMAMSGRTKPITIIAPQAVHDYLKMVKTTTEMMLSYEINFISIESLKTKNGYQPYQVKFEQNHDLSIDIYSLSHRTPSHAFKLTQTITTKVLLKDKLLEMGIQDKKIWGKLQYSMDVNLDENQTLKSADFLKLKHYKNSVIVAGDNDSPELLKTAIKNVDVLVHESTYTQAIADKRKTKPNAFDPMHSTARQVAKFAQSVKLKNLILTHFSARFQLFANPASNTMNMGHIRQEVANNFCGNFWLANDFDEFEIENGHVKNTKATNELTK